MSRKEARKRATTLAVRIEEHLAKLDQWPTHLASSHWKHEIHNWIAQVEDVLPNLGRKTASEWSRRIEDWSRRVGG